MNLNRIVFSIPELAAIGHIGRGKMRALLEAAGVPLNRLGSDFVVTLADLRARAPALWDSMEMVAQRDGHPPLAATDVVLRCGKGDTAHADLVARRLARLALERVAALEHPTKEQ